MKKAYTILFLRHSRPRFRKLHVSRPVVLGASALALALSVGGVLAPHLVMKMRQQSSQLQRLSQENRKLWTERNQFESALAEMESQLGVVEGQARRLAEELGVDELPSAKPAAGGDVPGSAPERFWFDTEVRSLRARANDLDQSIAELGDAFEERARLLAATPNMLPVEGWYSHGYGWRKDPWTGEREFHNGLDIVTEAGTPIQAPADGVVTRAARWGNYGKCVDIAHGYGYVTRYAHLSDFNVRAGERVERGALIGKVGSTGRSTGPHLHYEVFRDGRRVNPWKYLGHE